MKEVSNQDFDRAKSLYFAGTAIKKIAEMTGIKRTTLQYYVKKEWREERELRETELLAKVSNSHSQMIANMTRSAIVAVDRAMSNLASREEPPSAKEASDIVGVLEKLQKISDAYKDDENAEEEEKYIDPFTNNQN